MQSIFVLAILNTQIFGLIKIIAARLCAMAGHNVYLDIGACSEANSMMDVFFQNPETNATYGGNSHFIISTLSLQKLCVHNRGVCARLIICYKITCFANKGTR